MTSRDIWRSVITVCVLVAVVLTQDAIPEDKKSGASSFRCYSCTATSPGSDCELQPNTTNALQCTRKRCTIVRVEAKQSGRVISFYRGCDEESAVFSQNNCHHDPELTTCFSACSGDLCNGGLGNEEEVKKKKERERKEQEEELVEDEDEEQQTKEFRGKSIEFDGSGASWRARAVPLIVLLTVINLFCA